MITVAGLEWKEIWPELEQEYPDILLSLGSGYRLTSPSVASNNVWRNSTRLMQAIAPGAKRSAASSNILEFGGQSGWDAYTSQLSDFAMSRFFRLDPEFCDPLPAIDDVARLKSLQRKVQEHMGIRNQIRRLVSQLVASLFYFELSEPIGKGLGDDFVAKGEILCRLLPTSSEIRELGKFLSKDGNSDASFLIRDVSAGRTERVSLDTAIAGMTRDQQFVLGCQTISLPARGAVTEVFLCLDYFRDVYNTEGQYPISGFPRSLFNDEDLSRGQRSETATKSMRWASVADGRARRWTPPDPRMIPNTASIPDSEGYSTTYVRVSPISQARSAPLAGSSTSSLNQVYPSSTLPERRIPSLSPPSLSGMGPSQISRERVPLVEPNVHESPVELDAIRSAAELDAQFNMRNHSMRPRDEPGARARVPESTQGSTSISTKNPFRSVTAAPESARRPAQDNQAGSSEPVRQWDDSRVDGEDRPTERQIRQTGLQERVKEPGKFGVHPSPIPVPPAAPVGWLEQGRQTEQATRTKPRDPPEPVTQSKADRLPQPPPDRGSGTRTRPNPEASGNSPASSIKTSEWEQRYGKGHHLRSQAKQPSKTPLPDSSGDIHVVDHQSLVGGEEPKAARNWKPSASQAHESIPRPHAEGSASLRTPHFASPSSVIRRNVEMSEDERKRVEICRAVLRDLSNTKIPARLFSKTTTRLMSEEDVQRSIHQLLDDQPWMIPELIAYVPEMREYMPMAPDLSTAIPVNQSLLGSYYSILDCIGQTAESMSKLVRHFLELRVLPSPVLDSSILARFPDSKWKATPDTERQRGLSGRVDHHFRELMVKGKIPVYREILRELCDTRVISEQFLLMKFSSFVKYDMRLSPMLHILTLDAPVEDEDGDMNVQVLICGKLREGLWDCIWNCTWKSTRFNTTEDGVLFTLKKKAKLSPSPFSSAIVRDFEAELRSRHEHMEYERQGKEMDGRMGRNWEER